MDQSGLDMRLVEHWLAAAQDLDIRVTAPVELRDSSGVIFACEAFVPDFGSPTGAYVVSQKTERRVRHHLRNHQQELWVSGGERRQAAAYSRKHFVATLLDWGWFGTAGSEPAWYAQRVPHRG